MATNELTRAEWRGFCDRLSKQIAGRGVELDVASLAIGAHVEAGWVPLLGIVFDARADALEIALENLGHTIRSPRELHVEETPRGLVSLTVVTANDTVETLRFREPVRVPGITETSERRNGSRRPGEEREP